MRILGALILSVASMGIGVLVQQLVGAAPVSMIYLAGVVLSASLLGTRAGLVTAISNVIAYDYFVLEPRFTLNVSSAASGVNLVVFLAVGWQVGLFAERVRYERRAVRSLFDAGRSFSATADETALRQLIADAVALVARGRYVLVRDETGRTAAEHGQPPDVPIPSDGPQPGRKPRALRGWHVRPLHAEDENLGSVTWLAAADDHDLPIEATVNVLVDLGAAAIARARLSTEHAHLEVVAQTEQLRRALLASVSHDLRTPLAGIMGSSTSLLDHFDKYGDEVRRDLLSNIREQSYRLNRYVENLLGMTRLESGALQPKLEALSLEAIVFESWEVIADSAGATKPLLRVEEDQLVMADAALLRQVVSNLLENAVKFSPAGSTVEVGSEQRGGAVVLTISDQGVGASPDELAHFFEPFVRGKQSKGSGVGLGLFIARSFLTAMGGSIEARARRDGRTGLAFEVTLPAVRQLEAAS
jgi:two-component system sensor histidine kinase KdpD